MFTIHRLNVLFIAVAAIVMTGVLSQLSVHAAPETTTFVVTNLHDSGSGSLRDKINDAQMHSGAFTITFRVNGTITLSSTLPKITRDITIDGTGTSGITISGNSTVQHSPVPWWFV